MTYRVTELDKRVVTEWRFAVVGEYGAAVAHCLTSYMAQKIADALNGRDAK